MSDTFNGYHVWLGIPANEQPPNHYRLLGIAVFETDLDVIDHASDRQMAHVRTFQSGRHQALSQQILNELANARLCLLNAPRKAEYDEQLRGKLDSLPKAAAVLIGQGDASGSSGRAHHATAGAAAVPNMGPRAWRPPARSPRNPSRPSRSRRSRRSPAAANSIAGGKVSSASTLVSNKSAGATVADDLMMDIEPADSDLSDSGGFATTSAHMLRPRSKRRGQGNPSWQRPAMMGIMAAVVVMSFMALYVLVHWMTTDDNWRKVFDPSLLEPTTPASLQRAGSKIIGPARAIGGRIAAARRVTPVTSGWHRQLLSVSRSDKRAGRPIYFLRAATSNTSCAYGTPTTSCRGHPPKLEGCRARSWFAVQA